MVSDRSAGAPPPALPREAGCALFKVPPKGPAIAEGDLHSLPSYTRPGTAKPEAAGSRGPGSFSPSSKPRVRMLREGPHRARVNPDRAITRRGKRSSSGAIG